MEKVIFRSNKSGYTKTAKVCPKCTIACWRSYSVGCSVKKSGEDRFLFTPGCSLWQNKLLENLEQSTFFQHDDLKLSTKSCVGSVPCVTLLFLEVFGPEKKSGQVNRSYKYKRD